MGEWAGGRVRKRGDVRVVANTGDGGLEDEEEEWWRGGRE